MSLGTEEGQIVAPSPSASYLNDHDRITCKPKLVGINHVALEVGDIDQALVFYGAIFAFELRGRAPGMAFIDLGDQFLALAETGTATTQSPDRHFGLVVDDRESVRGLVEAAGGKVLPGQFLDFLDPWGNRVEVVDYRKIQFTKTRPVLDAMGVDGAKTDEAKAELHKKGMT